MSDQDSAWETAQRANPREIPRSAKKTAALGVTPGSMAAGDEGLRLPVVVLLDNVRSMYNVGAFFRAADGVGLEKLWLCGITAHPPKKAISKTALGAEETVGWEHDWDGVRVAEELRRGGVEIAAIETSVEAVDLFEWEPRFPVCVMFGHEVDGLRPELLKMADTHVRIPMLGQKKSLNVATAGGVVMYELLRKWRALRLSSQDRHHDRSRSSIANLQS
jgi:23S rRNA (guanosine2251-2'-O)-methyltransferase